MVTYRRIAQSLIYVPSTSNNDDVRFAYVATQPPSDIELPPARLWGLPGAFVGFPTEPGRDWGELGQWLAGWLAAHGNPRIVWFAADRQPVASLKVASGALSQDFSSRHANLWFIAPQHTRVEVAEAIRFERGKFYVLVNDDRLGLANEQVSIALDGVSQGCFQIGLALGAADLGTMALGQHLYDELPGNPHEPTAPLSAAHYPLLAQNGVGSGRATIDIADLINPHRTFVDLDGPWQSHLYTHSAHPLWLEAVTPASGIRGRIAILPLPKAKPRGRAAIPVPRDFHFAPLGHFRFSLAEASLANVSVLCGNSGNELAALAHDHVIEFSNQAALVTRGAAKSDGTRPAIGLSPEVTTPWLRFVAANGAPTAFRTQSDGAALYAPSVRALRSGGTAPLDHFPIELFGDAPIPVFPIAGLKGNVVDTALRLEAELLSHERRIRMTARAPARALTFDMAPRATTPQGFIVDVGPGGTWKQLTFASTTVNGVPAQPFGVTGDLGVLRDSLVRNKVFIVASQRGTFAFAGTSADGFGRITIAGWQFKLDLPDKEGTEALAKSPILILKFHDDPIDKLVEDYLRNPDDRIPKSLAPDAKKVLAAVSEIICSAKAKLKNSRPGGQALGLPCPDAGAATIDPNGVLYDRFVRSVTTPGWNGLLALNPGLDANFLPPEIKGLTIGMLPSLRLHHIGIEGSKIGDGLSLDASHPFGLLDYHDRKKWEDHSGQEPLYTFEVPELRVLFENGDIRSFSSKIVLGIKNLFDQSTKPVEPKTPPYDDHEIVLDGRYEKRGSTGVYSFTSEKPFTFELDANLVEKIVIQKVQFAVLDVKPDGGGREHVETRFSIFGSLELGALAEDWFSFSSLSFEDLGLHMNFTLDVPDKPPPIRIDFGVLRFDLSKSLSRAGSLVNKLPLKLKSFLVGSPDNTGTHPPLTLPDLGYLAIKGGDATFKFGLVFDLDLGSLGKLMSSLKQLHVEILLGWQGTKFLAGIKLPTGSGGKKEIGIEGIFRLLVEDFEFEKTKAAGDKDTWMILARNVQLEAFGKRMPHDGQFGLILFVDPSELAHKMAWFAGYKAPEGSGLFHLDFLGLGQRFRPTIGETNKCDDVIKELGTLVSAKDPLQYAPKDLVQHYDAEGGWVVATKFDVMSGAVALEAVVYDAGFYCLRVRVPSLSLDFEIGYRKISDEIGVYGIEIASPVRRFDLGAATITLPNIGISIYSNGDFLLDVGFPHNFDFSRSFQVEVLPFVGGGGFYIGKLSGNTSSLLPDPSLKTVLQLGVGMRIGLGKTFEIGILRGGISVTVFGIVEGALGYRGQLRLFSPDAYAIMGTVGIIGELYAVVNFGIARAELNIRITIAFGLYLRSHAPTRISIEAQVEVHLRVVIASFKVFGHRIEISITFHFSMTVRHEWTIGGGDAQHALRAMPQEIAWTPGYVLDPSRPELPLYFVGQLTSIGGAIHVIAMLALPCSRAKSDDAPRPPGPMPFDRMMAALLGWTIGLHLGVADPMTQTISASQLEGLDHRLRLPVTLARTKSGPLDANAIADFLSANFTVNVRRWEEVQDGAQSQMPTVFFPFLPDLGINVDRDGTPQDYKPWQSRTYDDAQQDALAKWYSDLFVNFDPRSGAGGAVRAAATPPTLASILFSDFFDFLIKGGVDQLRQVLREAFENKPTRLDALLAKVQEQERLGELANQASRFFLQGLRLPQSVATPGGGATSPVFVETQQQIKLFTGAIPEAGAYELKVSRRPDAPAWFSVAPDAALDVKPNMFGTLRSVAAATVRPKLYDDLFVRIPYLRSHPKSYRLYEHSKWSGKGSLFRLPPSLVDRTLHGGYEATLAVDQAENRSLSNAATFGWEWATVIELKVWRVPRSTGAATTPVPHAYKIGGASASERRFLDMLFELDALPAAPKVSLLHRCLDATQGDLEDDPVGADVFLVRTNLSTRSTPPPNVRALRAAVLPTRPTIAYLSERFAFLRLIHECSIVNTGGYYLHFTTSDGNDLDSQLFDAPDGSARLTVVMTWGHHDPVVPAYANAVWTATDPTADQGSYLHLDAVHDLQHEASVEPGCIGFRVYRAAADRQPDEILKQLEHNYSLLEYGLSGDGFDTVDPHAVLAIAPRDIKADTLEPEESWSHLSGYAGDWRYQKFVPAYKLVTGGGDSRYAGIGKDLSLTLGVRDLFGNSLPGFTAQKQLRLEYFDPLLPVGAWTGTVASYKAIGARRLQIDLALNKQVFHGEDGQLLACDGTDKNPTCAAIALYERIREQLNDRNANIFALTTFDASEIPLVDQRGKLVGFVDKVLAYLRGGASPDAIECSLPLTITVTQDASAFELIVGLGLSRPRNLMASEAVDTNAERVVSAVPAQQYATFAADLANAFGVYLATGVRYGTPGTELGGATADAAAHYWIVRKDLVDVALPVAPGGQASMYFAPAPLSNRLVTATVHYKRYDASGIHDAIEDVADVDLDVLARGCFDTIERFLAPEVVVGAQSACGAAAPHADVERILAGKALLAQSYADLVGPLFREGSASDGLGEVRDAYRDRLRIDLRDAYRISSLVQVPVTLSAAPRGLQAPRLYGQVVATKTNVPLALGNAKVELAPAGGTCRLSFVASATAPDARTVPADAPGAATTQLEYRISHVEYRPPGIPASTDPDDFEMTSWLQLLAPVSCRIGIGDLPVPLPVRRFPALPVAIEQQGTMEARPSVADPLKAARMWTFQFDYEREHGPDTLHVAIEYAQTGVAGVRAAAATSPVDALVGFQRNAATLEAVFAKIPQGGAQPAEVQWAVRALADLVETLATTIRPAASVRAAQQTKRELFYIDELAEDLANPGRIAMTSVDPPLARDFLAFEVPRAGGDVTPPPVTYPAPGTVSTPLSLPEPPQWLRRRVQRQHLDVMKLESGWAKFNIVRNERLIPNLTTRDIFQYVTPDVRFAEPFTPALTFDEVIDLSHELHPGAGDDRLTSWIAALFEKVFDSSSRSEFQVECSYVFAPTKDQRLKPRFTPTKIALFPRMEIDWTAGASPIAAIIAGKLAAWTVEHRPDRSLGCYVLDLAVYAQFSQRQQPILRLPRLYLPLDAT